MTDKSEHPKPDWEAFGKEVFERIDWPEYFFDIDGSEIFDMAKKHNVVIAIPGGFDPVLQGHEDIHGEAQPGDPWYERNFDRDDKPVRPLP